MARRRVADQCALCQRELTASSQRSRAQSDLCATCLAEANDVDDAAVSGSEIARLRELHGLTREQLAELLNDAEHRTGDGYTNGAVGAAEIERFEQSMIHTSFARRVAQLLGRNGNNMHNNGVSDESANIQVSTKAAADALAVYTDASAEADAMAEEFVGHLLSALSLGEPLNDALQKRYRLYHAAVIAERRRAQAVAASKGSDPADENRETEIRITPFRPVFRVPNGRLLNVEVWPESALTVPSIDFDDSVLESRSLAFEYLPTVEPRPIRRTRS